MQQIGTNSETKNPDFQLQFSDRPFTDTLLYIKLWFHWICMLTRTQIWLWQRSRLECWLKHENLWLVVLFGTINNNDSLHKDRLQAPGFCVKGYKYGIALFKVCTIKMLSWANIQNWRPHSFLTPTAVCYILSSNITIVMPFSF
jgi:hypothetical protein